MYFYTNPIFHSRMKHLVLDYHFVREKVNQGRLQINHISTKNELTDALKSLPLDNF